MEMSDGDSKCSVETSPMQTMPKMRVNLDYKEKDSKYFNVAGNVYHTVHYYNDMRGVNIDLTSPDVINPRRGRPVKAPQHRTTVRVQRRCQQLKMVLALANEEHQLMIAHVSEQTRVLAATQLETQREMDELKLKAAVQE
jgi:hypothetical protein